MTQAEAIESLEALAVWVRALALHAACTDPDARHAAIAAVPSDVAERCRAAFVDAGIVTVIDRDGRAYPGGALLLFGAITLAADALDVPRAELVRRAIDHTARIALAAKDLHRSDAPSRALSHDNDTNTSCRSDT